MRIKFVLSAIALSLILLWGCEKKEIEVFTTNDTGIYFQSGTSFSSTTQNYSDSVSYSFVSAAPAATYSILSAPVNTMGKVADYDRPFKVVVDEEQTTAIEGVHYALDLDTCYIPAGASSANVLVTFFRTEDLLEKEVRLVLRLLDNEYFTCYIDEYKSTNSYTATGVQLSGTSFRFIVSEMYSEPSYWTIFATSYLGAWSAKKYTIVNSICDLTHDDWRWGGSGKVVLGRFSYFAIAVQSYLQEQADAGNPIREADGSFMQLGSNYTVDYSAYE